MPKVSKSSFNFQDLMLHRIHEILLVASPYDSFILEEDGRLTQQILYEYLGMNLSYAPRVWHAKNASTGLKMYYENQTKSILGNWAHLLVVLRTLNILVKNQYWNASF